MGGGYTNVLDYACENENLIFDDILICLLKSVDSKSIYLALNKIKSSKRREDIKEKLFPDFFSKKEFELLYSNSVSFLEESEISSFFLNSSYFFNEEELCQSLINGNHEKLRNFLDSGISSNYIISCNIKIEDFVCKKGLSLLLITLVYCVERNVSWALFEIISLLLEKGVDLQQECCGINPLDYLCENEQFFLEDIVFCLLTSVSKEEAFKSLNKVEDIERREYLKKNIISKNSLFQFEYAQESTHNVEESIVTCENVKDSCDFLRNDSLFFSLKDIFGYSEKNNKLLLKISEFNQIEEILRNQFYLKKCDEEVCSKISGETFFSFIMSEIKDVYKRHKICLLFLENGYTPETIVSQEMNMASYLCSLRCLKKKSFESRGILIETLCVVFFFFKENTSITYVLEKINNSLDRKVLEDFFINKQTGKFSKNHINFINLIKKESQFTYLPLLKGFLEASLMVNKNVITDKCWNEIEDVFPFLNEIQEKLSKFEKQNCKKQKERRKILLDIFESLLIATVHPNSFKEEKRFFYEHWIQKNLFFFKTTEIKNIVLFLLKRYWGHLFKNKETNFFNLNNAQQIGLYNDQILFEVKKSITDVNLKESIQILEEVCVSNLDNIISEYQEFCFNENNFSKLEEILKNPSCLKKYDQQIPFKDKGETFISFLLLNDKDIYRRHMICLLLLKNGYTPKTMINCEMNLASYLCKLRNSTPLFEAQCILIETLCTVFFFFEEGDYIASTLEKLMSDKDKKYLSKFFLEEETGRFSKKNISFISLVKRDQTLSCAPLIKGFIEASLTINKNVITDQPWNVEDILPLLEEVVKKLCKFSLYNCIEGKRKKRNLLDLFEHLLLAVIHVNSFNEGKYFLYDLWIKKDLFLFKNIGIKNKVLNLLEKYLRHVFDNVLVKESVLEDNLLKNSLATDHSIDLKSIMITSGILEDGVDVIENMNESGTEKIFEQSRESVLEDNLLKDSLATDHSIDLKSIMIASGILEDGIDVIGNMNESRTEKILKTTSKINIDNITTSKIKELLFKVSRGDFNELEEVLKSKDYLKECNQEIQSITKEETLFSVLILAVKDIYCRHRICLLFLKNGFTSETIVSKNMSLASYLCSLRKRSPIIEHQHILMETLCLVFFFFKEGVSIETALEKLTSDQDKKRLSNFFIDRKTGNFSKKEIDCVKLIKQELFAPYLPLVKGFLDASLVMNKNIVTEKSLDIEYIFSLLNEVKRRLCNFLDFNSKEQERRAKNLLIIFESLLLSMIHNDSLNTRKDIFLSLFKRESLFFKNSRIEKIVLSLIKKYLGNFLNENNSKFLCLSNNQQINLEKSLSEVFEITICEKEVADHFVNFKLLKKLNKSNLNSSDKDNIEKIFLELLDRDFSQIENILKNPVYLQKYDELILDKNGKETFFSFLISEIDDVHIRHKLCILFLKYGFSLETVVSQEMNMVSYLCSLRNRMNLVKNQCVLLETLCAIFFFFEEGVSIKSALQELKSNQDRRLLETFFLDEKTQNFSKNGINFIHLIKTDVNYTYFPLLQGFLDASLVINRNLLTGEEWNVDYILPLLSEIKKKLCNFFKQNTRDQKRRKKLLLNIFESLLLATIHPNSFSEEKRILYNSWFYRETFLFKSVEIKNEVLILFQKHWGHILSKSFENSYISSNERINLNNFMIFPETAELLYITKNQDETMQSFNLKKRSITGFQQESQDVMNKKIRLL